MRFFFPLREYSQAGAFGGGSVPPGTYVETLTANTGGAVGPDGSGNINVVGDGTTITIAGNPGTNTLTASLIAGSADITITGDTGGPLTSNTFTFTGGTTGLTFNGSGTTETLSGTLIVGNGGTGRASLTNHSILVGAGTAAVTELGVATNGQLPIGSTGADPVLATITAGSGITVTNGAGSITIAASGGIPSSFPADSGTATPALGVLDIFGDSKNITTTGSGHQIVVGLTGLTQHDVLVGGASNAITSVAPSATSGVPLISQGAAADPAFGTAVVAGGGTGSVSFNTTGVVISGATSTTALSAITLTDGQLAIGSSAGNPAAATITAGTGITVTNGHNSISIATASGVATSFPADSGTATPSSGVLDIFGDSHNVTTTGSGHQVVVGLTGITQHSLQVGGASNALTQLGVATNGQLPIGSTGADPVLSTISAGTGITVTNGAGSITISAGGAGFSWTDATNASYTVAAENGYVADRGTLVTFTLPTNNSLGDTIKIVGKGAGGWTIVYGLLQNIVFGAFTTTTTSGSLSSTNAADCVELVCTTASASAPIFTVVSSMGNITIS